MAKLFSSVRKWIGNYLYFTTATFCIRSLVLSHSFVNHVVIAVLITYLTDVIWQPTSGETSQDSYQLAAVVINMLYGVSSILVCVLACITNIFGPFKVIATTNAAYVLGLVLLWRTSTSTDNNLSDKVFYGAGLQLALGEAGRPAALGIFLDDQYLREAKKEEHFPTTREEVDDKPERVEARQTALWSLPWFIGAAAPLALVQRSWPTQLLLSMILMGGSYLLFWFGVYAYSRNMDDSKHLGLCQLTQVFQSLSPSKEEARSLKFWKKPESRKLYYKEMLAMCSAFIVYSLVAATGSTFFFNQMDLLDFHIGKFKISYIYFVVIQSLSSSVSSFLWTLLVRILRKRSKRSTVVRIGFGLVCSVLCMAAAWQVEIRRKRKLNDPMYKGDVSSLPDELPMRILWLIPQFFLLGCMRGLAGEGLIEFFADRVDESVDVKGKRKATYFGSYASELVIGIGTILTGVSILVFRHTWLVSDIFENRLDKYYKGLVFIGVANLCYYFCIAVYFYYTARKDDNKSQAQIGFAADGYGTSENKVGDKKHYHHDVSSTSGGGETSELQEELKSSFDCCGSFF